VYEDSEKSRAIIKFKPGKSDLKKSGVNIRKFLYGFRALRSANFQNDGPPPGWACFVKPYATGVRMVLSDQVEIL
jgi:hypothetical protein